MQERRAYRVFRGAIIGSSAVVLLLSATIFGAQQLPWSQLLLIGLVAIICELAPVEVAKDADQLSQVTLTLPLIVMAMMVYGPLAAGLLGLFACVTATVLSWGSAAVCRRFETAGEEPAHSGLMRLATRVILPWIGRTWLNEPPTSFSWLVTNLAFNAAHLGLNAAVAAYVYLLIGGHILWPPETLQLSATAWLETTMAASIALTMFFIGDLGIFVMAASLMDTSSSYNRSWNSLLLQCNITLRTMAPSALRADVFLAVLAAILVYLYVQIGIVAIVVLFVPLYMLREAVTKTFLQVQAYRDTVTTLGTYMQRYHPYTRGHLKRVADMSERLARELRLPTDSIMLMSDAGMLHDIGKVAVSEEILDKIGRLTDEEWAVIKQHPVKGAEIVSHLPYLDKIVDWVKYHHKWIDGSGYPDGGTEDGQIPIEAAIIAVADAFDAMTDDRDTSLDWVCDSCGYDPGDGSRPDACPKCGMVKGRVYRQPLSLDDAVDQLRRGAGTQFSPPVVKAFLRMLERDTVHSGG